MAPAYGHTVGTQMSQSLDWIQTPFQNPFETCHVVQPLKPLSKSPLTTRFWAWAEAANVRVPRMTARKRFSIDLSSRRTRDVAGGANGNRCRRRRWVETFLPRLS